MKKIILFLLLLLSLESIGQRKVVDTLQFIKGGKIYKIALGIGTITINDTSYLLTPTAADSTKNPWMYFAGNTVQRGSGNVGIGLTNPISKLDVNGVITATGGSSTNWNTAYGWGNHASAGYVSGTGVSGYIPHFNGTGSIDSSSVYYDALNKRLGIGTTAPNSNLHIVNTNNSSPGDRVTITTGLSGFAQPSNVNSNSNGDKFVFWNSAIYKGAWGMSINGLQWFQSTSSGTTGDFAFYGGTSGTPIEVFRIKSSGKVGIGTTAPASQLEVKASGKVLGSAMNLTDSIGTSLLYVKNDGKVGIGTTAPSYILDVNGIGNISNTLYVGTSALSGSVLSAATNSVFAIQNTNTGSASALSFKTKNTEAIRIDPSQRVGIGTTAPASQLEVKSSGKVLGSAMNLTDSTGTSLLYVKNDGKVGIGTTAPSNIFNLKTTGSITPSIRFEQGSTTIPNYSSIGLGTPTYPNLTSQIAQTFTNDGGLQIAAFTSTAQSNALNFAGYSGTTTPTASVISFSAWKHNGSTSRAAIGALEPAISFNSGSTALFQMLGGGNIGIGTTNPTSQLEVKASGKVIGSAMNLTDSTGTSLLYVKNDGKVGIGRTDPGLPLDVQGNARFNGYVNALSFAINGTTAFSQSTTKINIGSASWTDILFNNSGKVGIGTTAPTARLEVNAKSLASASRPQFWTYSSAIDATPNDSIGLYVDEKGNVGIGTSAPGYALEVSNGSMRVSGDISTTGDIYAANFAKSSGSGGLSIEDDVWINCDYNNNDADTRSIIFAKNGVGAAGAELMRLKETGNLGINTTNPATTLHVNGTSTLPTILGGSAVDSKITYQSTSGAGTSGAIAHQFTGGNTGLTTIMTMLNDGKVGFGKTNPTQSIDVNGCINIATGQYYYINGGDASFSNSGLEATRNGIFTIKNLSTGSSSALSLWTQNTEKVRITPSGNLGIGTTDPATLLHVNGTSTLPTILGGSAVDSYITYKSTSGSGTSSAIGHKFVGGADGNTTIMTMLNDGKVGIGTTAPAYAFHVVGSSNVSNSSYFSNGLGNINANALTTTWDGVYLIRNISTNAASAMSFWTKNTEAIRIDPSQRVGIGTTNPTAKLHVAGTIQTGVVSKLTADSVNAIRFEGNTTVFNDLMFPFSTGLSGGLSYPTFNADSNYYTFVVDSTGPSKCVQYMTIQMPHWWKEGTTVYPHVHYKHETGVGTPAFIVKYKWYTIGGSTAKGWNWCRLDNTTGTTDKTHQMVYSTSGMSGSGMGISSILICQVYLRTTPANVNAWQFDLHIEQDAIGSNSETSKN